MLLLKINFVSTLIKIQNLFLTIFRKLIWPSSTAHVNNILIYKIGNIGDIITAYPSIQLIRANYPNAKITFLTSPGSQKLKSSAKILKNQKLVDEILYYYNGKIFNHFSKIRSLKIDLCYIMSDDRATFFKEMRNMIFFSTLNIKSLVGFKVNRIKYFAKAFSKKIPYPYENEVERNIKILNLTNSNNINFFDYKFGKISKKVSEVALKAKNPLIMAVGAKIESKKWDINYFLEISKRWIMEKGDIILIGGNDDLSDTSYLAENLRNWKKGAENNFYNLCSKTSIDESIFLIDNSAVLLSNDSGPAHLSSFTRTMVVTIQAPIDFKYKWDPYFSKKLVIRKNIQEISVEEVWRKLKVFN
tara:strand:- start:10 stop:1086 length:1077 start_codon:yes stop_codon:yes gene_type:complete